MMRIRSIPRKRSIFLSVRNFSAQYSCILTRHPGVENAVTRECFEIVREETRSTLKDDEVEVETVCLSVDPYMRCRFDGETHPQLPQYVTPFLLNTPLDGGGVGKIVRSASPRYQPDDYIVLPFVGYPWTTRCVLKVSNESDDSSSKLDTFHVAADEIDENQLSHLLGAIGMPGLTAYCGIVRSIRM